MCYKQKCKVVSLNLAHPVHLGLTLYLTRDIDASILKIAIVVSTPALFEDPAGLGLT